MGGESMAEFLVILGAAFLIWVLYRTLRQQPELLSKKNLSLSLTTLGLLAIALIAIIGLTVLFLQQ